MPHLIGLLLQLVLLFIVAGAVELNSPIISNGVQNNVKPTATHGFIVDAGSGGSRLHVFSWKPRIFNTVPPPLSYPEANEKWTARMDPGIHTYADNPNAISEHLAPLIDFAKVALAELEVEFEDFPIYFKATGGMRELESNKRERLLEEVRRLLSDKSFCPFFFRPDFARVISGEEEAIFSWTATNFLLGTLLPNSRGIGEVKNVSTYGTLDLGGSSTQIAFFVPSQDILEGLYKLQIGGQKQWNVYTKSFLQFGAVSARKRHLQLLNEGNAIKVMLDDHQQAILNYCFHSGYSEDALDTNGAKVGLISGPREPMKDQLSLCRQSIRPLLENNSTGTYCQVVYHGECSIAGAYQPKLQNGKFIGQSTYKYPWTFLKMPQSATLAEFEGKAKDLCSMNFQQMMLYYESNNLGLDNDKVTDFLPYYCFLSAYILTLLEDGYRFHRDQSLLVVDEVNGHRVGWALGAILFEINELPWELKLSTMEAHAFRFVTFAAIIGFLLGLTASYFVYREILEDRNRRNRTTPRDSFEDLRRINTIELLRQKQSLLPKDGKLASPYDNGVNQRYQSIPDS